ncbi:hypothetical protein [Magnetospirillum sp. SS-4]|uniref:hypothetical protein n=1 Tax=Magnetospirillum sp. SS-4 TaxID=2681465 RepID=UPI001385A1DB|nr:hypothetical protein [Magnetospirillum sp. SS-4]CAA7618241.1 conserved hypothetical protein [Magnetospirillum sp. SS-4]
MTIPNRPSLGDLIGMPVGDVAALPAEMLAMLQEEVDESLRRAKAVKDRLDGALDRKYGTTAAELRSREGKDTGTVRFNDGAVTVAVDLPKKVDWDQGHLAATVERIRIAGDDPTEYVDLAFKVPERKYAAWPAHIRLAFEAARTVKTGKPTFTLKPIAP